MLHKLIKTIEENGPLPQWAAGQASGVGIKPGAVPMTQGTFAGADGTGSLLGLRGMDKQGLATQGTNQYPQLFQQSFGGRK